MLRLGRVPAALLASLLAACGASAPIDGGFDASRRRADTGLAPGCGAPGQPCCAGATCGSGALCYGGICENCGASGQSCCGGRTCASGLQCDGWQTCQPEPTCGHLGEPCCNGVACYPGAVCGLSGACLREGTCGNTGQVCCVRSQCSGGLTCASGLCTGSMTGSALFRRCAASADCGPGLTCNLTYAGGLCTARCTTDRTCGASGICAGMFGCLPACAPRNDDCGPFSALCLIFDPADSSRRGCFPSCYEMPPARTPACVPGRVCEPYSGNCVVPPAMYPGPGENGIACAGGMECRGGRCFPERDTTTGAGTGYLGGSCFSIARAPPNEDFVVGSPWPRSNCPMGSVAVLVGPNLVLGDMAFCARECCRDAECRASEGYFCNRGSHPMMSGMPAYSTGACVPINCMDGAHTCPAGTSCRSVPGTMPPTGICDPSATRDS